MAKFGSDLGRQFHGDIRGREGGGVALDPANFPPPVLMMIDALYKALIINPVKVVSTDATNWSTSGMSAIHFRIAAVHRRGSNPIGDWYLQAATRR